LIKNITLKQINSNIKNVINTTKFIKKFGAFYMSEKILFSLENCEKCQQIKELIKDKNDIKIITYPHQIDYWTKEQFDEVNRYNVFDDLKITAPILWVDGKKFIGYLRIRKYLQDNKYI